MSFVQIWSKTFDKSVLNKQSVVKSNESRLWEKSNDWNVASAKHQPQQQKKQPIHAEQWRSVIESESRLFIRWSVNTVCGQNECNHILWWFASFRPSNKWSTVKWITISGWMRTSCISLLRFVLHLHEEREKNFPCCRRRWCGRFKCFIQLKR